MVRNGPEVGMGWEQNTTFRSKIPLQWSYSWVPTSQNMSLLVSIWIWEEARVDGNSSNTKQRKFLF